MGFKAHSAALFSSQKKEGGEGEEVFKVILSHVDKFHLSFILKPLTVEMTREHREIYKAAKSSRHPLGPDRFSNELYNEIPDK